MPTFKKYAFVLDAEGKRLDPTIEQNAWRLVRQHKARLVSKFPMVIAMYPELHALNFQSPTKHCKKANALKCKLVWRYSKIYWFKCA